MFCHLLELLGTITLLGNIQWSLNLFSRHVILSICIFYNKYFVNIFSLHTFIWFQVPFDSGRLVFPPVAAFVVAVILYTIFIWLFPMAIARSMFAGGLLGYVSYDMMHYYLHHGSPTPGSYLHQLKKYHVSHHFEDQQKGGLKSTLLNYCIIYSAK